jgi:transposase
MAKTFRRWDIEQRWLLPPSVNEMVPAGHLAHFVREMTCNELDLSAILETYTEERGYPPYHPVMMTAVLLYAYCQGIYSSRRIARACQERVDFMAVTAMQQPDFRTVSDFRKRHLSALAELFHQILKLCQRANMVRLGHVALDGTKMKANASKRKSMRYKRMKESDERLAAEIKSWFEKAQLADDEEDALYGPDRRGDQLPDWVLDKQKRHETIQAAIKQLEAEAKAALKPDDDDPKPPPKGGKPKPAPKDPKPKDKKQLNFTDPESKILKTSDGFIQGYNCQAAVDDKYQIIVACRVDNHQADSLVLERMVDQIRANTGKQTRELSADTGYLSEANLRVLRRRRIRGYIPSARQRHGSTLKRRRKENQGPLCKAMRTRLRRGGFRSRYRLRKQTVEPVFGQIKAGRSFRHFLLRGLRHVDAEWTFLCAAHNLIKLAKQAA